jgi:hypothetical protein
MAAASIPSYSRDAMRRLAASGEHSRAAVRQAMTWVVTACGTEPTRVDSAPRCGEDRCVRFPWQRQDLAGTCAECGADRFTQHAVFGGLPG